MKERRKLVRNGLKIGPKLVQIWTISVDLVTETCKSRIHPSVLLNPFWKSFHFCHFHFLNSWHTPHPIWDLNWDHMIWHEVIWAFTRSCDNRMTITWQSHDQLASQAWPRWVVLSNGCFVCSFVIHCVSLFIYFIPPLYLSPSSLFLSISFGEGLVIVIVPLKSIVPVIPLPQIHSLLSCYFD